MDTYLEAALAQSRIVTERYSTSFSKSVALLEADIRPAIYALYGMVRIADEIVDTKWPGVDARVELDAFEQATFDAINKKYSTNPILHAFQWAVHIYGISSEHIRAFFVSMRMDTEHIEYTKETYEKYIYGSAEVIGLMCLSVFCKSDRVLEQRLALGARALGAAFQKVNFLRDISADVADRKRIYFPGVHILPLTMVQKRTIEIDIEKDFEQAHEYVRNLPMRARKAVAIAYALYDYLFKKIKRAQPEQLGKRIRVPAIIKVVIILRVTFFGK